MIRSDGPLDPHHVEGLTRAAEIAGTTAIVRVPENKPRVILRYLDAGPQCVLIPWCQSAAEARTAVGAVKYYPEGTRGLAGVRPSGYGAAMPLPDNRRPARAPRQGQNGKRLPERRLKADFERDHPQILGALLDIAVVGLRRRNRIALPDAPRMADFAEWVCACCPVLRWRESDFLRTYKEALRQANAQILEESPLVAAIKRLLNGAPEA